MQMPGTTGFLDRIYKICRIGVLTPVLSCCASLCVVATLREPSAVPPEIVNALPAGGIRGGVTTVHVAGTNLEAAKALVTGRGVTVQSVSASSAGDSADVKLAIAADAEPGERELRIGTPRGVSGPLSLWVDVYPNVLEADPNGDATHAQRLERTPSVLNGVIAQAGDRDLCSFEAKTGETWVVDGVVSRIHSPLSPVVELMDESGSVAAEGRPSPGGDPRIIFPCERAGRYVVSIRDRNGRGGPDFVYRLAVGRLPVVTSVVPHGEKPGRKVAIRLSGANLGATNRTVVTIPADATGITWATARTPSGPSLPFPLIAEFAPVVGLTETDALMPLPTLPCALEGRFAVYPSTRFAFDGKAGQTVVFAMYGRSLGSDVDGAISIQDTSGRVLMESGYSTADTRLEFTPREQGIYVVEARDRQGRVGPDRTYRLTASLAAPDFRPFLDSDRINLPAGGIVSAHIDVERIGGFDGAIQVKAVGLPRGVTLRAGEIPAGQSSADVSFSSIAGAPRALAVIRLTASGTVGGKVVTHGVAPRLRRPDGTFRSCEMLPLAVIDPTPSVSR